MRYAASQQDVTVQHIEDLVSDLHIVDSVDIIEMNNPLGRAVISVVAAEG